MKWIDLGQTRGYTGEKVWLDSTHKTGLLIDSYGSNLAAQYTVDLKFECRKDIKCY